MSGLPRNYDYNGDPCGELGEALREAAKLRATEAEREALDDAIYLCGATSGLANEQDNATAWATCAASLRGLLDRHGGLPEREQPARNDEATPARSGETGDDSPDRE